MLAVYGYALSLLTQCMAWAGRQKVCVILTGDMNENVHTSPALASAYELYMIRISPDTPSTSGKTSALSKNLPIDHALVNHPLHECLISSSFRYDLPLADHYPLVSCFRSPSTSPLRWMWQKPCKEFPNQPVVSAFPEEATTFTQWSEQSRRWLQQSFGVVIPPKNTLVATADLPRPPTPPMECQRIFKAVRAILHLQKLDVPHWGQIRSLHRRLQPFGID